MLGNLHVNIGARVAGLRAGFNQAARSVTGFVQRLQGGLRQGRNEMGQFTAGAKGMEAAVGGGLKNLIHGAAGVLAGVVAFASLTAAIQGTVVAGIAWNQQLEISASKWETLLGSQAEAQEQLTWMADFAARTPFEFHDLDRASSRTKAFGFNIEQTRALMQTLGDTAAATGTGAAGIDRLSLALGQMNAKTKVSSQEMLQLTEMGIPAWAMLAEAMGVTVPELQKLVERGLVPANKAIPVLVKGMDEAFGGAMQKQAATMTGRLSTMRDTAKMLMGDAFKPVFGWLKDVALPGAIEGLERVSQGFKEGGLRGAIIAAFPESARETVKTIVDGLRELGGVMMDVGRTMAPVAKVAMKGLLDVLTSTVNVIRQNGDLVKAILAGILARFVAFKAITITLTAVTGAIKLMTLATTGFGTALNFLRANPIGAIVTALGLLVAAGVYVAQNWDTIKAQALNAWGSIKAATLDGVAVVVNAWGRFIGMFNEAAGEQIRASARAMRAQAENERALVDQREEALRHRAALDKIMAERGADADHEAVNRKLEDQELLERKHEESMRAMLTTEEDVWDGMADSAESSFDKKAEYLDDFKEAFGRAEEEMLTKAKRTQEDELEAYKGVLDEGLEAFKERQKQEAAEFELGQKRQTMEFERDQEDRLNARKDGYEKTLQAARDFQAKESLDYKQAQDDKAAAFQESLDDERDAFERAQEDMLDAFKARQRTEMDALDKRHEAERRAVEAQFRARMDILDAEAEAIRRTEQQEKADEKRAEILAKVAAAQRSLGDAKNRGDMFAEAAAQKRLLDAQKELADFDKGEGRRNRLLEIKDQQDVLKDQFDAAKQLMGDRQKAEIEALRESQAENLKAERRRLEDLKDVFDEELETRLRHYQDVLEEDALTFKQRQEQKMRQAEEARDIALEQFQRELEDEREFKFEPQLEADKAAFTQRQKEAFAREEEWRENLVKEYKRRQEDALDAYDDELEDLKASFRDKLAEQQQFINRWNAKADDLLPMLPPNTGGTGSIGPGTASVQVPAAAQGAVVRRPTLLLAGERETEAIMPLAWLGQRLHAFASSVAARAAGGMPAAPAAMAGAGGTQTTSNHYHFAPGSVVIPARDLKEMRDVTELLTRLPQAARARG